MKKILFLLLLTVASYGQVSTGQETEFDYGIKNNSTQTITTPTYLTTTGTDGTQGKIPSAYIAKTAAVQDSLNKKLNLPTGFLQGLQLSINADPTKFNIAAGYYVVTDFTNLAQPVVKVITYPGATGLAPAYLATANSTYVALDINGNVVSSASPFTNADRRTLAIIGNVVHSNNTTINVINEIKAPIVATTNQLHDFMRAIGFLNEEGNIYSPNGPYLQINKSAGKIFGLGINSADYLNPHQLSIPAQTALTFAYRLRGGTQYANTTSIDPNNWDNAGVLTSVPVGNRWTIQRINLFQSGLTRIQYGQTVYTSYNDAVTALPTQSFVTEQNIADNAVFRCYLIVQQGTTNLASAVADGTALFVPVDKFGNVIGNGSVALTYANIIAALGFTPENLANKSDSYTVSSSTTYASTKALVDGLGTKVGGTLTSGYVPKATGASILGDSPIFSDASNTGIGTVSPKRKLHISETSDNPQLLIEGNAAGTVNRMFFKVYNNIFSVGSATTLGAPYKTAFNINALTGATSFTESIGFAIGKKVFFDAETSSYVYSNSPNNLISYGYSNNILSTNDASASVGTIGFRIHSAINGTGTTLFTLGRTSGNALIGTTTDNGVDKLQVNGSTKTTALTLSTTPTTSSETYDFVSRNTTTGVVEKVSSSTIATTASPTFTGTPTAPTAAPGTNTTQIATTAFVQANTRPYKVYTALLSQTGTNAPTATVLENTLGGTIVWSYNIAGEYIGTLTGVFLNNKTFLTIKNNIHNATVEYTSSIGRIDNNKVVIGSKTNAVASDDTLNASIEIRVYN